jgi:hypothetical protein
MHADEHWFAILFYATWLEHWVNNVLMSLSVRSGIPDDVAVAWAVRGRSTVANNTPSARRRQEFSRNDSNLLEL